MVTRLAVSRIDAPGTGEKKTWHSWRDLRQRPAADPSAWPSVAVVAAHPDDEVPGAGGTMAVPAAAGARLRLPGTAVAAREAELGRRLREPCAGFGVCLAPWEADAVETSGRRQARAPHGFSHLLRTLASPAR